MRIITCLLFLVVVFSFSAQAQIPEGPNLAEDPYTGPVEDPVEPTDAEPPPPLICGVGDAPPGEATCNPVNDWWCSFELMCLPPVLESVAKVYAPSSLSPLGFPQPWHDHWDACEDHNAYLQADLAAHQYEITLWRTGQLVYTPPAPEPGDCDLVETWNNGDLWKPVSDNTGRPVVLVHRQFATATECDVTNSDGTQACRFRTIANGNRAHFDVFQSCGALAKPLVFRLVLNGLSHCWKVPEPCQRYE